MRHLEGREFIPDTDSPSDSWLDKYIDPEDQPSVLAAINEAIRKKSIFELEHRVRRLDGTLGWTYSRAVPLLDDKGDIVEWFGTAKDVPERKKAQEMLQATTLRLEQAHDLLSGIIENTTDLIAAIDTNFRYLAINEAYHRECQAIYGVDIHVGDSMLEMLAQRPEDQKNATEVFSPALQGKSVVTTQIYGDPGKSRRIYELHVSPIYDSQGRIIGAAHINTEITGRRKAEEALKKSEEQYRNLFENMSEMFQILEPIFSEEGKSVDFRYIKVNRATEALAGKKREEMEGKTAKELWGIVEDYWLEMLGRVLKIGEPAHMINYSQAADLYYDVNAWKADDRTVGIVFSNITELKKTEEALTASEAKYCAIVENAGEGIAISRTDGPITSVNQRMADMLGYDVDEMLGRPGLDFTFPDWERRVHEATVEVRESGVLEGEFKLRRKDGSALWTHYTAVRMFDEQGEHVANMGLHTDITERKRAEELLREADRKVAEAVEAERQRLFDMLETLPVMVCLMTPDYHIAFANRAFRDKFGESNGRHCYEYCCGYKEPCEFCQSFKPLETGQPHHWEFTSPDGSSIIDAYDFPFADLDGSPMVLEMDIDITERKQAEEALQQSEEQFRRAVEDAPTPMIMHAEDGQVLQISRTWTELTGYTLEDMSTFESWLNRAYGEGADFVREHVQKLFEGKQRTVDIEFPIRTNDGQTRYWSFSATSPGTLRDGRRFVVGIALDITERKKAEEALAESEQRYREIVETAEEGIATHDPDGTITYVNQRMADMMGYSREEIIGRSSLDFVDDEEKKAVTQARESLKEEGSFIKERKMLRKDGSVLWTLSHLSPRRDKAGNFFGYLAMHTDITERKMAEEALRKSKDELELRVKERTADLVKAKEAAEEAVKVKAAFMANMSHELRTPMNSVIGFTSLLLEEPLTVEQKEYVECVRNSGEALMTLINEVLDFSKMDREKMDLELQTFDLRNIMEEALDMVAAQAANKDLELNYAFDKNVPEAIIGDPGKLRQVLGNLLSNAVKFTNEGEVEVNVSSDPDQDEIHFTVRDTGIGISEEDIGKLFHPFSQLDLSYSRGFEGTGLGLAISKKLVQLMGGKIWVESEVGIGSIFHFTIPADTAPAKHKPFLAGSFEGKRVLIVEDNQTLRRILGRQLRTWGIMPMMASSIYEAVGLLQRDDSFDAVIIDASKDDALSMIAEKRDWWKRLPFIALTALGQKMPQDLFQAVLTKPLKPAKLFNALKDVLEKRETSGPVEALETEKSCGPLRILLAEDNISNQKVTLEMLKKLGYRADAVVNGQEVLEALERQLYDIIFMDVKMPVMNGIQATMEIRKRWPENGPKIIAVTAYALHGDKEKCLAAGMDGYIPKPVLKEDLAKVLGKYSIGA